MARGTFRGRAGGLQAPKRQIANEGFDGTATLTFGASTTATAVGSIGALITTPAATLVRTRGNFGMVVTASGTNTSLKNVVMGLTVVSEDAFAVGLTALPTPIGDVERMWQVWQAGSVYADGTASGESAGGAVFREYPIDSRGMRKVKAGNVLAVTFEGFQVSATTGTIVLVSYSLRLQLKL